MEPFAVFIEDSLRVFRRKNADGNAQNSVSRTCYTLLLHNFTVIFCSFITDEVSSDF